MSDIRVKSGWIDRNNSDVVVVTGLLNDLVLFDYCNNSSRKSGSRSKNDFIKQFKLLKAAPAPQADMVNNPPHYKGESGKPKKYQAFAGVLDERIKQMEQCIADAERKHSHYFKDVSSFDEMDTYLFCRVWKIQDDSGALHHALKKMMDAGKRGSKDKIKDITEARDTLNRYLEIEAMFSE